MTIEDFWKKYNHCPLCENYIIQGLLCDGCRWYFERWKSAEMTMDNFFPSVSAMAMMNREVDE